MSGGVEPKIKSNPITTKQKEILVEFISKRPEMFAGKFTASYTREKMKKLWCELTNLLNSVPEGPAKGWQQWRKTWVDLKKNTKAKISQEKKHARETGGGPPLPPTEKLEDKSIEDKLLTIISPVAVSGSTDIYESEVQFDFDHTMDMVGVCHGEFCEIELSDVTEERAEELTYVDHCYGAGSSKQIAANLKENTKPTTNKRKRITKTTRLTESLRNNKKFLEISEENLQSEKQFREKKIQILQQDSENRKLYQEKKVKILNNIAQVAMEIAADIRLLREHIMD